MTFNLKGIENEGNTCYLNSVIQLIFSSKELVDYLKDEKPNLSLTNLLERYQKSSKPLKPSKYLKKLPFESNIQHDAHEFMLYAIKSFKKICTVKGIIKNTQFKEKILSLSVEKNLIGSLQSFLEPKGEFLSWPTCLFLHFKRYGEFYDIPVDLPCEWRVMDKSNTLKKYKIRGFIYHAGDSDGDFGHYVTAIRRGNQFFICDDEVITNISKNTFLELFKTSYIALYIKNS